MEGVELVDTQLLSQPVCNIVLDVAEGVEEVIFRVVDGASSVFAGLAKKSQLFTYSIC